MVLCSDETKEGYASLEKVKVKKLDKNSEEVIVSTHSTLMTKILLGTDSDHVILLA